jgi:putative FmdB family regulatory protein
MPLYEFYCEKCDKDFELMRSMNDDTNVDCPECSNKLTKMISTSSFSLKGTGWYETDYKNKQKPACHTPACGSTCGA